MDLSERLKERELVYDGALLHVHRDVVIGPHGKESVREWIAHPGAAAVVALFDDDTTLLVRQFRHAPRREFLEVPAGKLDHEGEEPLELARRELEEETGYTATRLTPIGATYPCIGYSDEVIHLFVAEGLSEVGETGETDDVVEPVRLPFAEAVRMARAGELLDAKTVVALLRVAAIRGR